MPPRRRSWRAATARQRVEESSPRWRRNMRSSRTTLRDDVLECLAELHAAQACSCSRHERHRPYALLAELTYRCPLHCPYCSNPAQYPGGRGTGDGGMAARAPRGGRARRAARRAFPAANRSLRRDLAELVAGAREAGFTPISSPAASASIASRARRIARRGAGFRADQFPGGRGGTGRRHRRRAGARAQARGGALRSANAGSPLSVNVVLHRAQSSTACAEIIAFAAVARRGAAGTGQHAVLRLGHF